VISDPVTGGTKNYCKSCGLEILDQASEDLLALRGSLG
jgi:hypothetical protein